MQTESELLDYAKTVGEYLNVRYFHSREGSLHFDIRMSKTRSNKHWYAYTEFDPAVGVCVIYLKECMQHASCHEIEVVLLHELMHVAQARHGWRLDHKWSFQRIAEMYELPIEARSEAPPTVRTPRAMLRGDKLMVGAY